MEPSRLSEADRERLLQAVWGCMRGVGASVGDAFLRDVPRMLAEALGSDIAFVGELVSEGERVAARWVWWEGAAGEPFDYVLEGTPCEDVVGRTLHVHPRGVAWRFPKDRFLAEAGIESYVGAPLFDSEGSPTGIVVALGRRPLARPDCAAVLLDVFAGRIGAELERWRALERAKRAEARAMQAQKLESLGVLAGGLAHDLNNLLSGVLGGADLACLELPEGHPAIDHLATVRTAAQLAARLCRQLLAYAGQGTLRIEPLHLSEVVRQHDDLLKTSVGGRVLLRFCLEEDPGLVVDMDRGQFGQVLLNLVINAAEAISESGRGELVCVRTGRQFCDREYLRGAFGSKGVEPGEFAFLEVVDDGPGIPPETLARIFDPFFTTKFAGRGLGLSAILGIVRSHRGAVRVYTEPHAGTSFKVLFPMSRGAGEARCTRRQDVGRCRFEGRALVVDDNDLVRRVIGRMLERLGVDVVPCSSGAEALDVLAAGDPVCDVVLLDLTMPGISGEDVFRRIRRLHSGLPVVLMSGFDEQEVATKLVGRGAAGFLQKPYRFEELRGVLERALPASGDGSAE